MEMYDVIVVGAGPAGGSTALHCARLGLKTLVLEEHPSIGEPVHCGECLSQVAVDRLKLNLPKEVISEDAKGVRVIFPDSTASLLTEKGYVLEKHLFERWLVSEALNKGSELKLNSRVLTVVKLPDKTWEIDCGSQKYYAKILVDASGVNSIISARLNLNKRFESVIGMQYEMREIPRDGYLDFYLWPELAPHGYLWMIPKSDGRANIGLVTTEKIKAKVFLDEFVKRMSWQSKAVVKTFGGLIPCSGPLENTIDDGLILVGDAAGFTSPLFEGGTHLSLHSGQMAAETAKMAIDKSDASKSILQYYVTQWKSNFPDYTKLIVGKNKLYEFSIKELNDVGHIIPKELSTLGTVGKLQVGINLALSHRNLLKKGVTSAFEAFAYSRAEHYGW